MLDMNRLMDGLKNNRLVQDAREKFESSPGATLIGAAAIITSVAKLIEAVGSARGSFAYAKGETRRTKAAKASARKK